MDLQRAERMQVVLL